MGTKPRRNRSLESPRRGREPRRISAYIHNNSETPVPEPDTAPGNYYVTLIHETRGTALLLGPYPNNHAAALAAVPAARNYCLERDGSLHFDARWGTARFKTEFTEKGKLNHLLPELIPETAVATH